MWASPLSSQARLRSHPPNRQPSSPYDLRARRASSHDSSAFSASYWYAFGDPGRREYALQAHPRATARQTICLTALVWLLSFAPRVLLSRPSRLSYPLLTQNSALRTSSPVPPVSRTYDCIIRTGLIPPTEVPSPGSKEPSCRLRVMPVVMLVIVSPPSDAKTDQHDETSAEQDAD